MSNLGKVMDPIIEDRDLVGTLWTKDIYEEPA